MKKLKPKDKIIIVLLSAMLAMQVIASLRTTATVSRTIGDMLFSQTIKVWVWEIKE